MIVLLMCGLRLVQIAAERFPMAYAKPEQQQLLASRVIVIPVNNAAELAQRYAPLSLH